MGLLTAAAYENLMLIPGPKLAIEFFSPVFTYGEFLNPLPIG
jgi:hypothetical protein